LHGLRHGQLPRRSGAVLVKVGSWYCSYSNRPCLIPHARVQFVATLLGQLFGVINSGGKVMWVEYHAGRVEWASEWSQSRLIHAQDYPPLAPQLVIDIA
jgi:hypothetical protein